MVIFDALIIFFFILVLFSFAAIAGLFRPAVDTRLSQLDNSNPNTATKYLRNTSSSSKNYFAKMGRKIYGINYSKIGHYKRLLLEAGFYGDEIYYTFLFTKLFFMILLPASVYVYLLYVSVPPTNEMVFLIIAFAFGYLLPDGFVILKKKNRQQKINEGLPEFMDLLNICVNAGLSIDYSLKKVSDEMALKNKILSDELKITMSAINLGQTKEEALHNLGERTGLMELKSLAALIIQSEKYGTDVSEALRVHSDDMRHRRHQKAEELAGKTTIKLIFPLVIFIFPAIFIVVAGPAVIRIIEVMFKN